MKKLIFSILVLFSVQNYSQEKTKPYTFNNVQERELKMNVYEKDTTANALVLFEYGNTIVENKNDELYLKTTVFRKIKIFNKDGKKHATITIPIYNNENKSREKVKNIKAITHNFHEPSTYLSPTHIYTNTINDHWKEVTFTFPNVKPGSIIEYQYDLISKFFFNFKGWVFQSDIPKIQSEFHALIPGNWIYNRHLTGNLKLTTNEAVIKKKCLVFSSRKSADCEKLTYIMKDIPAFISEENFTTTKDNYISKIKFELSKIFYLDGTSKRFTSSWKDTDKRLKKDDFIGGQLSNKSFFSTNMPAEIITISDSLNKAKAIYQFIKNHYSLDDSKHYIFSETHVKNAFKKKIGGFSEINIGLINALQAAGLDAKIMLSSTRDNGFPTKTHPVMTDFNYITAMVKINGIVYLLDATNKNMPFGMLPFKVLNSLGRVLDFKNGSYWQNINPQIDSFNRTSIILNLEDQIFKGKLKSIDNGYFAFNKRENIKNTSKEEHLIEIENKSENLTINDYKNSALFEPEKPFVEEFEFELEDFEEIGDLIYIDPFIVKLDKNPFLLNERAYPIDFGYKRNHSYIIKINLPSGYIVKSLPKTITISLPNNGGTFVCSSNYINNAITIYSKYALNKTIYPPQEYAYLKEFYKQIIKTQNSLITLEKIKNIATKS